MTRVKSKLIVYGIAAVLIGWPLYQIYDALHARTEKKDAGSMLYQVALFQLELLTGYLNEAPKITGTEQLNGMKQAAYSMGYTHERLAMAFSGEQLVKLESVDELLQFIMRLQLGGERPLKPDEAATLAEVQKQFKTLYDDYAKLLTSGGRLVSSQNDKIAKTDKAIADMLRKKMLK